MCPDVLVQAELADELAAANVTCVVEIFAVRWHVFAKIGKLGEGGRALGALDVSVI